VLGTGGHRSPVRRVSWGGLHPETGRWGCEGSRNGLPQAGARAWLRAPKFVSPRLFLREGVLRERRVNSSWGVVACAMQSIKSLCAKGFGQTDRCAGGTFSHGVLFCLGGWTVAGCAAATTATYNPRP